MSLLAIAAAGLFAAGVGTFGGLGGSVLLVPILVLGGLEPAQAAPLGLLTVAAGSLAAAAPQIEAGYVHHRLGITTETAASAAAICGALLASTVEADALRLVLAATAVIAGSAVFAQRLHAPVGSPAFAAETPGEWPGTLGGTVNEGGASIAYMARRRALGVGLVGAAGFVAGLSGTSGGYLKTPVMASVMQVPTKVAAATTTFTVGVTAAAALLVFVARGGVELSQAAAVVAGAIPGGAIGARIQQRATLTLARYALSVLLVAVAAALVATG